MTANEVDKISSVILKLRNLNSGPLIILSPPFAALLFWYRLTFTSFGLSVSQKSMQDNNSVQETLDRKDKEMKELRNRVEMLQLELAQRDASKETTQREMLSAGRENLV